ncbi:MAG: anaerobic ribonucleoside-triphosphate reductase activating protein [Christensenellales bacterium]|jgi:pyruvate formate lyase activating enzyme
MQIAGFIKNSFVDYPGLIAAVVFVPGCNMDCWYCHNKHLLKSQNLIDPEVINSFLDTHKGFIDGVVISGGEPTLQSGIEDFIKKVRDKGYRVKLDTNGTRPKVIKRLIGLTDYIAMDTKAPPGGLHRVVSFKMDESPIWQTADILMDSGVDYEFRTTFMPFLNEKDIVRIAKRISGSKRYALQQYRKTDGQSIQPEPHSADTLNRAAKAASKYVCNVVVRGI